MSCWAVLRSPVQLVLTALLTFPAAIRAGDSLLKHVADIPLPGGATRFDYQSLDADAGRLYFSHMGDGKLMVFDTPLSVCS